MAARGGRVRAAAAVALIASSRRRRRWSSWRVISLAALVDPFGWMPSAHAIWADCTGTARSRTASPASGGTSWPTSPTSSIAGILVVAFARAVPELRRTRVTRYDSAAAMEEFRQASVVLRGAGKALAALAAIPLLVAIL